MSYYNFSADIDYRLYMHDVDAIIIIIIIDNNNNNNNNNNNSIHVVHVQGTSDLYGLLTDPKVGG